MSAQLTRMDEAESDSAEAFVGVSGITRLAEISAEGIELRAPFLAMTR